MGTFELRPIDKMNDAEVAFVYRVRTHPDVAAHLNGASPACYSIHQSWMDKRIDNQSRWLFLCIYNDEMVGYAQVYNFTLTNFEVGWALHPDYQGKGLGKRAVETLLHEVSALFSTIPTVRLEVKESNPKAHGIYSKAGFQDVSRDRGVITMERPNIAPTSEAEITYVGHAGFLLKRGEVKLLCDPWFYGAFYGSWYPYPYNRHVIPEVLNPTHVYISHGHEDHCDYRFLNKLDRDTPIITANFKNKEMQYHLKGFKNVTYLNHLEKLKIGDIEIQMFIDVTSPKNDSAISMDFGYKILNSNDCYIPSDIMPQVDMLWSQFSGAFHYPHCYDFDAETKKTKVEQIKQGYLNDLKARLLHTNCSVYVPSAGPACFLDPSQEHLNDGDNTIFYPWKTFAGDVIIDTLKPIPGSRAVLKEKSWSLFHQNQPKVSLETYRSETEDERKVVHFIPPLQLYEYFSRLCKKHARLLKLQPKTFNLQVGLQIYTITLSTDEDNKVVDFYDFAPTDPDRNYSFTVPKWVMKDILKGGRWDSAFLSNRIQLHRNKDEYDTVLFQLLCSDTDHNRTDDIARSLIGSVEMTEQEGWVYQKLCPHAGADLSTATIENGTLKCPRHNWKWDLNTGKCLVGGNLPLQCHRK